MRSKALLFIFAVLCASNIPAYAISWRTQMNCATDYYAYCSKYTAGSAGCHACMRAHRPKLSTSCVSALIDDGVIPKTDVEKQKLKIAVASTKVKLAPRRTEFSVTKLVGNRSSAKNTAFRPKPKAASSVSNAVISGQPEMVEATLVIDQQTFEAFKYRAPYFLAEAESNKKFERTAANTSPQ